MWSYCSALCAVAAALIPVDALAQSADANQSGVHLELNTLTDTGAACRISFVADNKTDVDIAKAVFETVIFDASGSVMSLTLFDFRDLPANRLRVRQFDVSGVTCDNLGKVLINGASTCTVQGANNAICSSDLFLTSRVDVELLG